MKKVLLIILILLISINLLGCESKETKLTKEIEELKKQSEEYYANGDINNTIKLYEKILESRESIEDRKYLDDLIIEKESLDITKSFLEVMEQFRYKFDTINTLPGLSEFMMEIKDDFDALEKVDTTKETEISAFVRKVLKDDNYIYIKERYNEDYIKNAQHNADLNRILDKALGGVEATATDALLFDLVEFNIGNALKSIPKELPNKYKN